MTLGPPHAPYLPDRIRLRLEVTETAPGVFCWLWTGSVRPDGYGQVWDGRRPRVAHRVVYAAYGRTVPDGLVLQHDCHVPADCPGGACTHRRCCNPGHLRPAPQRENASTTLSARHASWSTGYCHRGHDLSLPDAVYVRGTEGGRRRCAACTRDRERARARAARARGPPRGPP